MIEGGFSTQKLQGKREKKKVTFLCSIFFHYFFPSGMSFGVRSVVGPLHGSWGSYPTAIQRGPFSASLE